MRIKFAFIFTGLTIATFFVLWMTVRFVSSLSPAVEKTAVLPVRPVVITAVSTATTASPIITPPSIPASFPLPILATVSEDSVIDTRFELTPNITPTPLQKKQPTYPQLIIPSLEISRVIKTVPVVDGQWDISQVASDIGWLQTTGAHPDDEQGMTFVGHATRPWPEIAGPLAELMFMEMGDEIIYRYDGTDYIYILERYLKVNPESVEKLYTNDGEMLSLTTCSNWNFTNFQYDKRLIAQARLVRTEPSP